jgi:hypothetical protein
MCVTTTGKKKLPIGIQTFGKIRGDDYYYVDKTEFAWHLIQGGSYYFLSRPRRFGKSLFLDTLKELFEGNETLFQGLYIHDRWDWSKKYPVIRISFGGGVIRDRADLEERLGIMLGRIEEEHGITGQKTSLSERFRTVIEARYSQCKLGVVILIDEYDKPILDQIENGEVAKTIRDGLKDFYSVIKDDDAHIKFAFLTGVSKFSKVSLFSGLNNLKDITLDERYSALCGYTEKDLDEVFGDRIERVDREKVREWYNGYNWLGEAVYNPFDILLYLDSGHFKPYWFETGTPTFLIKLLKERAAFLPDLGRQCADSNLLSTFDVGNIPTEALMFQAGYLTIAAKERKFEEDSYILRYPNREVYQSLNGSLLRELTSGVSGLVKQKIQLWELLQKNDFPAMGALVKSFFASIPYQWHTNNDIAEYEGYYASVFYAYFASLGLDIAVEESSHAGRLDMAVRFNGHIYLFEFKVVELEPAGRALEQIKERGYADKYRDAGQPIHLIGVEFSKGKREVVKFDVESVS